MLAAIASNFGVMLALVLFIAASVWLGTVAQRRVERGSFLQGYFLGNRGLGAWALALTATVQSGGTFMGFPSLVYSHGWVVALWIAGYMVVPLTSFAVLGKRLAQLSRRTGAITVPDLFRERFDSPATGLIASLLIIVFMSIMMVAQFKAGAIVMKLAWPGDSLALAEDMQGAVDWRYLIGLGVFSVSVVGYTMIGGFLASVWTDLFQSIMMFFGVLILLVLIVPAAGGLEQATMTVVNDPKIGPSYAFAPGYGREFLPVGMAFSFFFVWVFSGVASPAGMVRVMATESTDVVRKSIVLLACYNCLIYLPLVAICIAGRALIPDLDKTDEIIPRLALLGTKDLPGGSFLSGLILAAPFGAVMATVSCYLLVISSGLVRDIYMRFFRPHANSREIKHVTYLAMAVVAAMAIATNIQPVKYLQALVVFSGESAAASFVAPAMMAAYWRRATAKGVIAGMLAGSGTMLLLVGLSVAQQSLEPYLAAPAAGATAWTEFLHQFATLLGPFQDVGMPPPRLYYLLGLGPIVWGIAVSSVAGVLVSLVSKPPSPEHVSRLFDDETQFAPRQ